jgi:ABC-type Fe3+/spermidine/putrescine transport system ATPase subunit
MQTPALDPMSDRIALRATHLRKVYGNVTAVDDVSFTVNSGEIVGLLGPNGAGKTTTINMVLGVLAATTGSIEIDGFDISTERARALARTNFAAVYAALPGNLTVIENLRSRVLPPSYVFEGMRALLADRPLQGTLLVEGSLVAAAELLLAAYFYRRVYERAVRTGLLARYSAESAS